jgi:hypothetical protein
MTPAACNPSWVNLFSALATPMIAIIVAYVAWRQWRTAREKLKIDLFERRLPIYEQTRDILSRQLALGNAFDSAKITDFGVKTRVSRWLYDASIADYLQEGIVSKLQDLHDVESELEGSITDTQKQGLIARRRQLRNWIEDQLYNVLDKKFGRYLHVNHDSIRGTGLNWRRGGFRLWFIFALLWCAGVLSIALASENVTWNPWASPAIVHVKASDTRTWDYPAEWGVERITDDLKRRLADEDKKEHEWAAQLPATRKAECKAIPHNTKFEDEPSDCVRLFWAEFGAISVVPQGWESQVRSSVPAWRAIATALPWAVGLPLAVLVLIASLFWPLAGFKSGKHDAAAN